MGRIEGSNRYNPTEWNLEEWVFMHTYAKILH